MPRSRVKKTKKANVKTETSNEPFSDENDDVDVTKDEHLEKLKNLHKKYPVVLIFIYADWCGHCTTFKPIWEKYKATPGRRIPIARINETMLKKTHAADAKLDGFPSGVLSGSDMKLATQKKDSGEITNSLPFLRDENAMVTLLKTDPSKLVAENNISPNKENSPSPTKEARNLLSASSKRSMKETNNNVVMSNPSPPNINNDSSPGNDSNQIPPEKVKEGGALYRSMLQFVKGIKATVSHTRKKARGRARTLKRGGK
jgi:thiol-disulfide isomerase/thioredoxin